MDPAARIIQSAEQALEFAKGKRDGARVTFSSPTSFNLGGIVWPPGVYQIKRVSDLPPESGKHPARRK